MTMVLYAMSPLGNADENLDALGETLAITLAEAYAMKDSLLLASVIADVEALNRRLDRILLGVHVAIEELNGSVESRLLPGRGQCWH